MDRRHTELICDFGSDSVEPESGTSRRKIHNLEIVPAYTALPACANRFHPSFFGCEPSGIAFELVGLTLDVCDFELRKNPVPEPFAKAIEGCADSIDFGKIDSRTNDHSSLPDVVSVRRPCFTPLVLMIFSAMA